MALDGYTLSFLAKETDQLLSGARVDKIYQPDPFTLVFHMRAGGENHRLLISAHPQTGRFSLTREKFENPETPPLFCMVMRKHLEGSRLTAIRQVAMERVVHFIFSGTSELGDTAEKVLIGEFMGKHSNLVLTDGSTGTIHDAIHRFPLSDTTIREIIPGRPYTEPPAQEKRLMTDINLEELQEILPENFSETTLSRALLQLISGISPAASRELCLRASLEPDCPVDTLGEIDYQRIYRAVSGFADYLQEDHPVYYLVKEADKYLDFTPGPYLLYQEQENLPFPSLNQLIEEYMGGRDRFNRLKQKKDALLRAAQREILRLEKRHDVNEQKIQDNIRAEEFRIFGDLLTANLYQIKQGRTALVVNYYDENQRTLEIPMEEQLTPNQNAQKYYKRYNKTKSGAENAREQLAIIREELAYLETITLSIEQADQLRHLEEIRTEMTEAGYLKKDLKNKKRPPKEKITPETLQIQGFEILVGHNNKQNDWITMKLASPGDLWFHVKDIPGSHVLVKNPNRKEIPSQVIEAAARLAAENSKAKNATIVPVDYTEKKHVKKPPGAKPGFVLYEKARTIQIKLH